MMRKNPTPLEFVQKKLYSHIQYLDRSKRRTKNEAVIKIIEEEKRQTAEILDYVNLKFIDYIDADSIFELFRKDFNEEIARLQVQVNRGVIEEKDKRIKALEDELNIMIIERSADLETIIVLTEDIVKLQEEIKKLKEDHGKQTDIFAQQIRQYENTIESIRK
ncbi:hypothetical protein F8M41_000723 [Gigaspora margarita]|uniref:Uncharacterized protein n=1 Tax=Gigaspora margarita TaxID=4874 RepID=A0A8H4A9L8_GIGMA|nr:hypothetical protein F8M41_000723 [Gigaspora margarita]